MTLTNFTEKRTPKELSSRTQAVNKIPPYLVKGGLYLMLALIPAILCLKEPLTEETSALRMKESWDLVETLFWATGGYVLLICVLEKLTPKSFHKNSASGGLIGAALSFSVLVNYHSTIKEIDHSVAWTKKSFVNLQVAALARSDKAGYYTLTLKDPSQILKPLQAFDAVPVVINEGMSTLIVPRDSVSSCFPIRHASLNNAKIYVQRFRRLISKEPLPSLITVKCHPIKAPVD